MKLPKLRQVKRPIWWRKFLGRPAVEIPQPRRPSSAYLVDTTAMRREDEEL